LSLTIQLDINMLTHFLKLLMAASVLVSLVRSAHFDLKDAKDVNIMSNECLKSGSCRGVLFHGSAPVPPPPSEGVSVSTTTNVQTRRKRAVFHLQGSSGTKVQSNECLTDGSCHGVRFHGPAAPPPPPPSEGVSVSTTTNVQTRRKRANFNLQGSTGTKVQSNECLADGSCRGVRFHGPAPPPPPPPSEGVSVSSTTNVQTRQRRNAANFNFQGEPQVTVGATTTNVDPSTITFAQQSDFENLNANSNPGHTTGNQGNNVVESSNAGIFLRPRNQACQCSNGMPGAFICIKDRDCQCECNKFVVYKPELSRKRRSPEAGTSFNFKGDNVKPQILNAECLTAGSCEGIRFQDTDSSTDVDLRNTKNNNIQVLECMKNGSCDGAAFHGRKKRSDEIHYKADLYNNNYHL